MTSVVIWGKCPRPSLQMSLGGVAGQHPPPLPNDAANIRKSLCSVTSAGRSAWAPPTQGTLRQQTNTDESFFPRHYPGQRPEILWIGCKQRLQGPGGWS